MYFLDTGSLNYDNVQSSKECPQTAVHKGDWFCETILWMPWIHRGRMRAHTDCTLLLIDSEKFRKLAQQHPRFIVVLQTYAKEYLTQVLKVIQEPGAKPLHLRLTLRGRHAGDAAY